MGDTPSKPQFRVSKNGIEARQDAEIKALRNDFAEYRSYDIKIHERLGDKVDGVVGKVDGVVSKLGAYTFAGKLVWGLVGIFLASLAGLFGWQTARISHLHDKMDSLNSRLSRIEAIDQHLDTDLDNLRYQIRELRKHLDRNGGREE